MVMFVLLAQVRSDEHGTRMRAVEASVKLPTSRTRGAWVVLRTPADAFHASLRLSCLYRENALSNEAVLVGVRSGSGPRRQIQLGEDVAHMAIDGPFADS